MTGNNAQYYPNGWENIKSPKSGADNVTVLAALVQTENGNLADLTAFNGTHVMYRENVQLIAAGADVPKEGIPYYMLVPVAAADVKDAGTLG